jgi:hypothetical protein
MPGYEGTYRAVVIDTADPTSANRVRVQVPDVTAADQGWATPEDPHAALPNVGDEVTVPDGSTETMWAAPDHADAALPAVGDDVWVRFQDGSVDHPLWSGGSGGGESADR